MMPVNGRKNNEKNINKTWPKSVKLSIIEVFKYGENTIPKRKYEERKSLRRYFILFFLASPSTTSSFTSISAGAGESSLTIGEVICSSLV